MTLKPITVIKKTKEFDAATPVTGTCTQALASSPTLCAEVGPGTITDQVMEEGLIRLGADLSVCTLEGARAIKLIEMPEDKTTLRIRVATGQDIAAQSGYTCTEGETVSFECPSATTFANLFTEETIELLPCNNKLFAVDVPRCELRRSGNFSEQFAKELLKRGPAQEMWNDLQTIMALGTTEAPAGDEWAANIVYPVGETSVADIYPGAVFSYDLVLDAINAMPDGWTPTDLYVSERAISIAERQYLLDPANCSCGGFDLIKNIESHGIKIHRIKNTCAVNYAPGDPDNQETDGMGAPILWPLGVNGGEFWLFGCSDSLSPNATTNKMTGAPIVALYRGAKKIVTEERCLEEIVRMGIPVSSNIRVVNPCGIVIGKFSMDLCYPNTDCSTPIV